MLEIPMTQPSAKAGRTEKSASNDEAKSRNDRETSDTDFEAAYAADGESETRHADEKTSAATASGDDPTIAGVQPEGETPDAERVRPDEPEAFVHELAAVEDGAAETAEKDVIEQKPRKPVSETSELAFAQRVMSEKRPKAESDGKPSTGPAGLVETTRTGADGARTDVPVRSQAQPHETSGESVQTKAKPELPTVASPVAQGKMSETNARADQIQPALQKKVHFDADARRSEAQAQDASELDRILREKPPTATQNTKPSLAPPTVPPVAQAAMPMVVQTDTTGLDTALSVVGEVDSPSTWDPRGAAPATLAQTLSRPETPGMIGRQMAGTLQRFPDRPVEVSLNPEELGRVRLNISTAEGGITVHVLAERPETLDLMRRHIDQLGREFQELGYENINFAFNEGQSEQSADDGHSGGQASSPESMVLDPQSHTAVPITLSTSSGVDLRL